jgi:hypothetical protein
MTSKKVLQTRGRKKFLAAAIPLILAAQAQGIEFYVGDVEMSLDTQLSIGSSWRTEDRSAYLMQGISSPDTNQQNDNDGDANFDKGDAFSQVFKGTHDFQVTYKNFGAFVRGKYWYDTLLEDGKKATFTNAQANTSEKFASKADGGSFSDDNASDYAKFSGAQILDAFVYGEFEVGSMPLDVRLGKQVLSWGESTFIQGGINQTNPFDVAALRRPGAELKEGLIPVNMAFASIGLTENLSAEAFYQLEHQETVISHCGTFFATNDFAPEGCGPVETVAGSVSRDPAFKDGINSPSDDGQFGVAFRYFAESLDTEFGFFALNVHSRVPLVSGRKSVFDEMGAVLGSNPTAQAGYIAFKEGAGAPVVAGANGALVGTALAGLTITSYAHLEQIMSAPVGPLEAGFQATPALAAIYTGNAAGVAGGALGAIVTDSGVAAGAVPMSYHIEYPEDQQIAGLSFATNLGGIAVSGELTHKLDVPVQINSTQLLATGLKTDATYALTFGSAFTGGIPGVPAGDAAAADAAARGNVALTLGSYGIEALDLAGGEVLSGFKTYDVSQIQVTGIKLFDQVLGANRWALVAEAGYTHVHDFDENGDIAFGGNSLNEDRVTEGSWGYRLRVSGDYSDVFAGVSLAPVLSFSHDVDGTAPGPGGNFVEEQKVTGLALNAVYANIYSASIGYTMYDGGVVNTLKDRDNASITLGVQF